MPPIFVALVAAGVAAILVGAVALRAASRRRRRREAIVDPATEARVSRALADAVPSDGPPVQPTAWRRRTSVD